MNYPALFRGDGRTRVMPEGTTLPGLLPQHLSKAQARQMVDRFEETGRSQHSTNGGTLWVVLLFCYYAKVAYTLNYRPGLGITVTRDEVQIDH